MSCFKINNLLKYKGYHTNVQFDAESMKSYGKIEGISDLVNFECCDMNQVEKGFHAAVDDYLEFCDEVKKATNTFDKPELDITY